MLAPARDYERGARGYLQFMHQQILARRVSKPHQPEAIP